MLPIDWTQVHFAKRKALRYGQIFLYAEIKEPATLADIVRGHHPQKKNEESYYMIFRFKPYTMTDTEDSMSGMPSNGVQKNNVC